MNPEYSTARADAPALASASAPDAAPMPASRTSDTPLGTTRFLTGEIDAACAADGINAIS